MTALTLAPDLGTLPPRLAHLVHAAEANGWTSQWEHTDATRDGWEDTMLWMPWRKTRDGVLTLCVALGRSADTGRWSVLAAEDGARMTAAWADTTTGPVITRRWDLVRQIHHMTTLSQRSVGQLVDRWRQS